MILSLMQHEMKLTGGDIAAQCCKIKVRRSFFDSRFLTTVWSGLGMQDCFRTDVCLACEKNDAYVREKNDVCMAIPWAQRPHMPQHQ